MVLSAEPRVSFHTASIRPSGDTDMVPNHWNAWVPAGSSLTRTGVLQVWPPSVLRMNMTSSGSAGVWTEASTYTHPALGPVERSTAIHSWPSNPAGLGPPRTVFPPRLTCTAVKVGVTSGFRASVERHT